MHIIMDIMKRIPAVVLAVLAAGLPFAAGAFEVQSNLKRGQPIPPEYYHKMFGCTGSSQSPMLEWKSPPKGTKSFAITFFDTSAPTGSGFWHYVAYDIPPDVSRVEVGDLAAAKLPAGAKEGYTDLGKSGYFGPCPPVGRKHRYLYTIHALKTEKLDVPADASAAFVSFNLWLNTLGKASFEIVAGPRKAASPK